jgi:peptidyl-prolyl cis-trans isomerase A (cyclophilin A)
MKFSSSLALFVSTFVTAFSTDPVAPDTYEVIFTTDVPGNITVSVDRSLSPLGADRFYALVKDSFFSKGGGAAFFRVVDNFVVQFGISGDPAETSAWNNNIPDDPVATTNAAGTLTFATAGPNTRTSQLFFNLIDNSGLDAQGFSPFGSITDGFDVLTKIMNPTPNNSGGIDQSKYENGGNEWLESSVYVGNYNSIVGEHLC